MGRGLDPHLMVITWFHTTTLAQSLSPYTDAVSQ